MGLDGQVEGANHVLAIRDLRQRVALGMEVDLNIVDLLEVGTGAALPWQAFGGPA